MKKIVLSIIPIFLILGCNPLKSNSNSTEMLDEKGDLPESIIKSKDTTVIIDGVKWYECVSIENIPTEFITAIIFGEKGEERIEIPNNQLKIIINQEKYIIKKEDIVGLENDFIKNSIFHSIHIKEITKQKSIFEIIFGIPDTDNVVLISLIVSNNGLKKFVIDYPEDDDE